MGKRTAGGGEAAPGGMVFRTGQAAPVTLGWVTYQTSAPSWHLTPLRKRTRSEKGCVAGACRNLRKLGISKVQTLPQSWLLPCWPSPCSTYLKLGLNSICRVYGHRTLPSPAPAAAVWPWPTLHLLETPSDHQHKFLYWCSLCPHPEKDVLISRAESA